MKIVELVGKTLKDKELWELTDDVDTPYLILPDITPFHYYIEFHTDDEKEVKKVMNKIYKGEWRFITDEDRMTTEQELNNLFK